jgi:hypothetical protein
LNAMDKNFSWKFVPSNGTAGGILVGFKSSMFDILGWQEFKYCGVARIRNQGDGFEWRMISVYGSPYDETKHEFIEKLHVVMNEWQGPILIGGDFNVVRCPKEKSNGNINFTHTTLFNESIDHWGLIDIKDPCRVFSWSNNQRCPIMATLDKVLITTDLDAKYPYAKVKMLWEVGRG